MNHMIRDKRLTRGASGIETEIPIMMALEMTARGTKRESI